MKKTVFLLVFLIAVIPVFSDVSYREKTWMFGGSIGYSFYTPGDHIKKAYSDLYIIPVEDKGTYGGLCFDIWMLFRLGKSPVKMGFSIGGSGFRNESWTSSNWVWEDTGEALSGNTTLVGFHGLLISDFQIAGIQKNILHLVIGAGMMLFDESMEKPPFDPVLDFIASAKLVFSIPISRHNSIDPQIGIVKGFSKNKIFAFSIGIGFSGYL